MHWAAPVRDVLLSLRTRGYNRHSVVPSHTGSAGSLPLGNGGGSFTRAAARIRSRVEGDKSRATPMPGLRCVAMRMLADTAVDVTAADWRNCDARAGRCLLF